MGKLVRGRAVDSYELNKIFGAVIFVILVAIVIGEVGDEAVSPEALEQNAYVIAGAEQASGEAAAPAPAEAAETPAEPDFGALLATADATAGKKVFRKCAACHKAVEGAGNGIGPNLYGVVGRAVGGVAGFSYSDALAGHGGSWDVASLDAWLSGPRAFIPGNKMGFGGLKKATDRANLIRYLQSLGE